MMMLVGTMVAMVAMIPMMVMMVMVVFVVGHGESRECDNQAEGQQQEQAR